MAQPRPSQSLSVSPSSPPTPNLQNRLPRLEPRKRRKQPENPTPVPETPPLPPPPDIASWTFKTPTRRILSPQDHETFLSSDTDKLVKAWIFGLADAVVDTPSSAIKDADLSDNVKVILKILDEAETFVSKAPPDEQGGSRFGNKAFRGFVDLIHQSSVPWHRALLGLQRGEAIVETSTYLIHSFGNPNRIDYGSGHELNFLMWLLCLNRLSILHVPSDSKALVLRVFPRYLEVMRIVQMVYYLEPAGSHGVWGLDDYQFLPFLFGASQLLHHPYMTPRSIHQDLALEESGDDYLYLNQVRFVNSTKTVRGLRWHSPMLDDISSARNWAKIDGGMRRMFAAEVLGKLPVMQHFLFGSLIPATDDMSEETVGDGLSEDPVADKEHDHKHNGKGWGDCCGIKVPSSIAAAQEIRKRGQVDGLRRIPFD